MTYEALRIGKQLAEYRKAKDLSQDAVAQYLKVTRQAISKWERDEGMPDLQNLKMLSQLLDFSIDELLSLEQRVENPPQENSNLSDDVSKELSPEGIYRAFSEQNESSKWWGDAVAGGFALISVPLFMVLLHFRVPFAWLVFFLTPILYYMGMAIPIIYKVFVNPTRGENSSEWK